MAGEEEAPMTIRKVCIEIKSSKAFHPYMANKKHVYIHRRASSQEIIGNEVMVNGGEDKAIHCIPHGLSLHTKTMKP